MGLAVGFAVFTLIVIWVNYEMTYDRFEGSENIYRLSFGGNTYLTAGEGPHFAENCIEIDKVVRFKTFGNNIFTYEDKNCKVRNLRFADSTVFDALPYDLIMGDPETALVTPGTMVISETISRTLFGDEDPVGEVVIVNGGFEAVVTGVMKDTHHTFNPTDVMASFVTIRLLNEEPDILESLRTSQYQTYFLLKENVSVSDLREKIDRLNVELFSIEENDHVDNVELVNISDIYFDQAHGPRENHGNKALVMIFLAVSILTLGIACINFINLTIAKSSDSALEVGIRKVNGATRKRLFNTFLLESILLSFLSSLFALLILYLILPAFSNLVQVQLSLSDYFTPGCILAYLGLGLLTGVLAGIIPAIRLSAFNPLVYLRKLTREGKPNSAFRTGLVVFQFTVSIILIISVFVVSNQIKYIRNHDLGFNKENIIRVGMSGDIGQKKDLFKERVEDLAGVVSATYEGATFDGVNREVFYFQDERYITQFFTVEPDFIDAMEIEIISGRGFSYDRPADRLNTCMLNESTAKLIGLDPAEAPGKIINRRNWYLTTIPTEQLEILGVVKDFHFTSLRDSIKPALLCWGNWFGSFSIRIQESNQKAILANIKEIWDELNPSVPFEYRYMDEMIDEQYNNEERLGKILIYFTLLALLIASFGLLGLTAISVQARTREIGIKKVHGASRSGIVKEISAGFLRWIVLSIIIGTPISIYIMNKWLTGFAYHTRISVSLVVLSWILLIGVSFLTVFFHTVKISDTNPLDSLRYE